MKISSKKKLNYHILISNLRIRTFIFLAFRYILFSISTSDFLLQNLQINIRKIINSIAHHKAI